MLRIVSLNKQLDKRTREVRNIGIELEKQKIHQAEQSKKQQDDLQQQIDQLKQQVQAKAEAKRQAEIAAANAPKPVFPPAPVAQASGGDAKMFIYMHESGNNPNSINRSSGACGLGQALPCGKMGCALGDYACQDAFFTNYMLNRYGSWENARAFWLSHNWW